MPQIPNIEAERNAPAPAQGRRATGEDFGAAAGRALERLGDTVTNLSERYGEIYQDSQANLAIAKAQRKLNDYSNELKYGPVDPETGAPQIDPATGKPVAPVDPSQHAQLYQKKVDEVREETENSLDGRGRALQKFYSSYEPLANNHLLAVQTDAIGLMHQQSRANLETSLQQMSEEFVRAPEIGKPRIQSDAAKAIKDAVDGRMITPQEGFEYQKRFAHQAEFGNARKIIQSGKDGPMALVNAIDNGEFSSLPIDQQEKLRNMALTKRDSDDRHALAQVEHKIKFDEYKRKLDGDKAFKNLIDAQADHDPELVEKVEAQKNVLSAEQYHLLRKEATSGETPSDKGYVNFLMAGISRGTVSREDIEDAAGVPKPGDPADLNRLPRINSTDFLRALEAYEKHSATAQLDNPAKYGETRIHKFFGGDSPGKKQLDYAAEDQAMQEYQLFLRENPKATADDIHKAVEDITRRGAVFNMNEQATALLAPKFVTGSKLDLAAADGSGHKLVDDAAAKLIKAYKAKEISKAEYDRNAALIMKWKKIMPAAPVTSATQGK